MLSIKDANIETLKWSIGQQVLDEDKSICMITNKTVNSIEVFIRKKSDKGIDCTNWFYIENFIKRFKIL